MGPSTVSVREITAVDAAGIGEFLHRHLNRRVPASTWAAAVTPPWEGDPPNHGFQLIDGGTIVGVYLAVYSVREHESGTPVRVCNLAAFCVLEGYRAHSLRLVRALLSQKGYQFTDLSPSGSVIALNERLGFRRLDTSTQLVANLPWASTGVRVITDPELIAASLRGRDAAIFRDHRDARAARHLVATCDGGHGYLVFRRDRRKRLPLFATPLHAGGDPGCLEAAWRSVGSHLLLRHGLVVTLAERRVLGFAPGPGVTLRSPRTRMARGGLIDPPNIDYLYSELTLVDW